ncbi:rRNA pseudouridine synthase [Mesorhizobium sp. BR1-1-16]|uniref:pseudouridine synthase n=1 Tax=Mesorhizobium sp. BR1-1-16 TaxID=2876653 RepID=UPI001CCB198F|nr:pseudouridine synthase [Mesorhizobium sp. BR1-1-16]MBZ9935811.1 rRNA pseudouridine synthase [Mesorhizobium sp. BR1-1-16]
MNKAPTARLDKLLANLGYGSRREVQTLIEGGRVILDGEAETDPAQRVYVTADLATRMTVSGEPLDPAPGFILMLNKPLGVTCSQKDIGPLIYSLLPERWRRRDPAISTVGRLDKETSGLILMTDDGALLHRIIAPKSHVPKRYRVSLARPLEGSEDAALGAGTLMLEGEEKPLLPVAMETVSPTECFVTLNEGRYHQVRRMFAALGNHVAALHRDRVGGLDLPDELPPGAFHILDSAGIEAIFAAPRPA